MANEATFHTVFTIVDINLFGIGERVFRVYKHILDRPDIKTLEAKVKEAIKEYMEYEGETYDGSNDISICVYKTSDEFIYMPLQNLFDFYEKVISLDRLYTREDLNLISEKSGFDVMKAFVWKQKIILKTKN